MVGLGRSVPRPSGCDPGDSSPENRLRQALCQRGEVKLLVLLRGDDLLIPSYAVWELVQDFPNTVFHCSCFK